MEKKKLALLSNSILSSLAYFSIFKHPLTADEVFNYCHYTETTKEDVLVELSFLTESGIVSMKDGYYFLSDEDNNIQRRISGEKLADSFFKSAKRYSNLISKFPFVRGVFISGSLSKGYMDKHSDVDYFIITEPKRLWLCRTLLILYKKIFLLNSRKYFCVNYFIDTDHLQIPDQNIFTSTELVFVIPMYNPELYIKFRKANHWTHQYFPNLHNENRPVLYKSNTNIIRLWLEKVFSGSFGESLDSWCFKKTLGFWEKKFKDFDRTSFDMEFRSKKSVSKHHPRGFQNKIMTLYALRLKSIEKRFDLNIVFNESLAMAKISQY